MGLLRMVVGAAVVWVVWRLLDGMLAGTRRPQHPRPSEPSRRPKTPNDEKLGEYVDFEEVQE